SKHYTTSLAPEISPIFGELVGLWIADLFVRMGSPKRIHLVELGPERGTLINDVMRTSTRYEFEPVLHFVETSPALRKVQSKAFPKARHHDDLSSLPEDRPLLIIANEYFAAQPVHQLVRSAQGWHERVVGLEEGRLSFIAGEEPMDDMVPPSWRSAAQGTMIETSQAAVGLMREIATRLTNQGGAALIIDNGPRELRAGSTLKAQRRGKTVDALSHAGEAKLTSHVDFELLAHVAEQNGADVMGLEMQGEWLRQLGIETRTEALQRRLPDDVKDIQRRHDRLVEDGEMGAPYKVLGICGRRWPIGVGFE
ncbi:MAG: SAM-dependent methyltransferase, partial [Pseudomonadota bacterium]